MIELITFDLDNTLWETSNTIRRADSGMRLWLSKQVPEFERIFDLDAINAVRQEVVSDSPDFSHDVSRVRTEVLFRAIQRCGYGDAEARTFANKAFQVFLSGRHNVSFFEGSLEMLDTLSKHYLLGVLTNGNADFRRLGLNRFFSFGFSPAEVGFTKPHPAMFEAALARTGVTAAEAVHVGDHPIDDIQGAREVGMFTIWVNLEGIEDNVNASLQVSHLEKIPAAIKTLI